jgi:hypothetical protein
MRCRYFPYKRPTPEWVPEREQQMCFWNSKATLLRELSQTRSISGLALERSSSSTASFERGRNYSTSYSIINRGKVSEECGRIREKKQEP